METPVKILQDLLMLKSVEIRRIKPSTNVNQITRIIRLVITKPVR